MLRPIVQLLSVGHAAVLQHQLQLEKQVQRYWSGWDSTKKGGAKVKYAMINEVVLLSPRRRVSESNGLYLYHFVCFLRFLPVGCSAPDFEQCRHLRPMGPHTPDTITQYDTL